MTVKPYYITLIILLLTLGAVANIETRGTPRVVRNSLNELPLMMEGFIGVNGQYPQSVYDVLNAETHVYRHYRNLEGMKADLYIGYYSTEKGGRSEHTPYGCLPGAGWGILKSEIVQLYPEGYSRHVEVNSIHAVKGKINVILLHWYQADGNKVLKNGVQLNLQRWKNRIVNNRSDGAFIQISAFSDAQNLDSIEANVHKLATAILKILPRYWPIEQS